MSWLGSTLPRAHKSGTIFFIAIACDVRFG
jgi:hypothetical protein